MRIVKGTHGERITRKGRRLSDRRESAVVKDDGYKMQFTSKTYDKTASVDLNVSGGKRAGYTSLIIW
jgi:hypothetical protein